MAPKAKDSLQLGPSPAPKLAVTKAPFNDGAFAGLRPLLPIAKKFNELNGKEFVHNVLGPLIVRYGLEETLGVCLVHRHFDVPHGQRLVEYNNVTVPWVLRSPLNRIAGGQSMVYETSWMLREDGRFQAFEFTYSLADDGVPHNLVRLNDERYQNFLIEFTQTLRDWRFERIIGLRAYPGDHFKGGLEVTQENCNIILSPCEYDMQPGWRVAEIMFFWAKAWKDEDCECICAWPREVYDESGLPSKPFAPEQL